MPKEMGIAILGRQGILITLIRNSEVVDQFSESKIKGNGRPISRKR